MNKNYLRIRRKKRIRKKIRGTSNRPRLSVFRSNRHIYIQAIDDDKNVTLIASSDLKLKKADLAGTKKEIASKVGTLFGKALKAKKIKEVVFDRGGYKYHGRVKELADSIRSEGIIF
jgi:large subunit ribosomal protein L18